MRGSFGQYITVTVDILSIGLVLSGAVSQGLMPEIGASNVDPTMLNDTEYLIGTMFQCSLQDNPIIGIHFY